MEMGWRYFLHFLTCSNIFLHSFICSATWRLVQVLSMATTVRAHLDRQRQGKVEVNVKAMGSAPALRQPHFTIDGTKKFSKLTSYLKDEIGMDRPLYSMDILGYFHPIIGYIPSGELTFCHGKIHHAINGKIHYTWPFSIAMLVHQRVDSIGTSQIFPYGGTGDGPDLETF